MEIFTGILFIDIETVSVQPTLGLLSEGMQIEWSKKARLIHKLPDNIPDPSLAFEDKAGIYSEFAKIVCISIGNVYNDGNVWKVRLKSLSGHDEQEILRKFSEIVEKMTSTHKDIRFCGHNIKEFDMPFICRRFVINNLPLPQPLQLSGKKPWEIHHIDTMELWKFGDNKNFTSLSLLAQVLGIPSPKSDIDGSQVSNVYWNDGDIKRISRYCMQDVFTTAKVYLRLKGNSDIDLLPEYVED